MSSTRYSMPRPSATSRPSRVVAAEESRSGSSNPSTRCGPKARTASAAHTELSTPPESATTTPRRCRTRDTISTRRRAMRAVSAAQSMWNTDADNSGAAVAKLALQVAPDAVQAVKVVRHHLVILDLDAEGLLEIGD